MPGQSADASLFSLAIDRAARGPLHRQLTAGLRNAITSGRVPAGHRLPSSRTLSEELRVSRNTVLTAYTQLRAEGYLEARVGAGTVVRTQLPLSGSLRPPTPQRTAGEPGRTHAVELSSDAPYVTPPIRAFAPGVPAIDAFPVDLWGRLTGRVLRREGSRLMQQVEPIGYEPLRRAIADHIRVARGVACDPSQVIVTNGAQQAFGLCCDVLFTAGDRVWFENPGFSGTSGVFDYHRIRQVRVGVDRDGMNIKRARRRAPEARGAYVTPTHQFPLGMPLSLERRYELLNWADRAGGWIIEDDYDSEFRFDGPVLPALYGLDQTNRVIYIGTFSKSVFPSLRIGFAVVPRQLINAFAQARAYRDHHSSVHMQAVLAEFMNGGHFARHVSSMRKLYRHRQQQLRSLLHTRLGQQLEWPDTNTGLHATAFLPPGSKDGSIADRAGELGVTVLPLTSFYRGGRPRPGLVLGFGGFTDEQMADATDRLAQAIHASL